MGPRARGEEAVSACDVRDLTAAGDRPPVLHLGYGIFRSGLSPSPVARWFDPSYPPSIERG